MKEKLENKKELDEKLADKKDNKKVNANDKITNKKEETKLKDNNLAKDKTDSESNNKKSKSKESTKQEKDKTNKSKTVGNQSNKSNKKVEKKNIIEEDIIGETIRQRKKLPKELKDKISNSIFFNVLIIVFMMISTLVINLMFNRYSLSRFETIMKIVQITVCLITIVIFEYSYKKDSLKSGLYGIEFLLYSIAVLYVPYMYNLNNLDFLENVICAFVIYYIVKSISTLIYYRHKYLKENMSDVKEIVKEETKGYLDEESKKTLKEKKKK